MRSNIEWRYWGKTDPLHGAMGLAGRERSGPTPWTDTDFYDVGAQVWGDFKRQWSRRGMNTASCVEIGCGAGRLTKQLAGTFDAVHALDVSEDMIAYARRHIDADNVRFCVVSGSQIPLARESVSGVFSTDVFSHFDSAAHGWRYFAEASRVLTPGGTLLIQLPIHALPGGHTVQALQRSVYDISKAVGAVRAEWRRFLIQRGLQVGMKRGVSYDCTTLMRVLERVGLTDVEIGGLFTTSTHDFHTFVFARKPGERHTQRDGT